MLRYLPLVLALAFISFVGCGPSIKEETIEVKASNDPLQPARSLLEGYAKGQPVTSEVTSYEKLVEDVRKVDAKRADILQQGLEKIKKTPNNRVSIAKDLLRKLAPSMNAN